MPIYDYHCDGCGHDFSAVQSFKDEPVRTCPSCGKVPRRLVATPAIVFKGSGWYKTDSRTAPKAEKAEKADKDKAALDGSAGADRSEAGEKKTEAPADKTPTSSS